MSQHSVAEARDRLPDLIDRALMGEDVVIVRHGRPVAELRAVPAPAGSISADDLDWLAARRVGVRPAATDAGELVSGMRDDDR